MYATIFYTYHIYKLKFLKDEQMNFLIKLSQTFEGDWDLVNHLHQISTKNPFVYPLKRPNPTCIYNTNVYYVYNEVEFGLYQSACLKPKWKATLAKAVDLKDDSVDLRRVGISLSILQTCLAYLRDDGNHIAWIRNGQQAF